MPIFEVLPIILEIWKLKGKCGKHMIWEDVVFFYYRGKKTTHERDCH
jgi:hypothetical protein